MHKEGVISLLFFGLVAVLVVTHPTGFASAVTAVGGQTYNESSLLTGSNQTGGTTGTVSAGNTGTYSITGASK